MLIRSQDRKCFVNAGNVFSTNVYGVDDSYIIDATDNIGTETLGIYSSERKALEVLDMICDNYENNVVKAKRFPELYSVNPIFNMPKDEDVVIYDDSEPSITKAMSELNEKLK